MGEIDIKDRLCMRNALRINRESLAKTLFFIGYGLWLVWKLISISMFSFAEGSLINTAFHALSLLCLLGSSVVLWKFDSKTALALILCAFGLVVKIRSGSILFIDLAFLFYASRAADFKTIAHFSLCILSVGAIIIVSSTVVGIIPDHLFARGNEIRHGLGYLYTTNLSHLYLNIVLLYLYWKKDYFRYSECLLLLSIDILIFILTDSRNSCGLVALSLVCACLFKLLKSKKAEKVLLWISRCSFGIFTALLIVAALAFNPTNEGWSALNRFTSNRIAQDHASLIKYGVKPFGQEIEFSNRTIAMGETDKTEQQTNPQGDPNIVESSFLNILITKGFVALLLVLAAFWVAVSPGIDRWMSLIMLMIAMHSAFDFQLTNLLYTTFLLWVWDRVTIAFSHSKMGSRIDRLANSKG